MIFERGAFPMVHKYKAILPNMVFVLDAYGLEQKIAGAG